MQRSYRRARIALPRRECMLLPGPAQFLPAFCDMEHWNGNEVSRSWTMVEDLQLLSSSGLLRFKRSFQNTIQNFEEGRLIP